ncbi:Peroxiredoxin-2E [Seminavis robusta]|uniref:Peroxiredoxin-2E n=1 Tax=Seminavis robusta TaxID=568900 RepID=A0A9N8ED00_9STRA|nr:Peroxiredoxin-2E [Seminavis robusta]|eukprot:Sro820_g207260.1 Peroxiredoxin-2E (276) ;mRNA; f:30434-31347
MMRVLRSLLLLLVAPQAVAFGPTTAGALGRSKTSLFVDATVNGAIGRSREKKEIDQAATIRVGEALPADIDVIVCGTTSEEEDDNAAAMSIRDAVGNGKAVLVGMPGAFTPTCTEQHLPGYVEKMSQFSSLGYDSVAVLTTNDRYVNDMWAKSVVGDSDSPLQILSDGDGDLVRMLGLSEDMGFGVGVRSKRFALVLENGTVTQVLADEGLSSCSATSAENVLKVLSGGASVASADDDSNQAAVAVLLLAIAAGAAATMGGVDMGSFQMPSFPTP